jgi:CheY-like chemotaxis protein
MINAGRPAKILLIDSNVLFSKRLSDALKKEGFEVVSSTQPAFALTALEYDTPAAVVCATNMREMGALEIAKIIHADPKNATLPIIAMGDGSQRALMEAYQAGCEDYIDRQRPPAVIASHIRNIIISKAEGFQPTQMLPQADTSLSGSLTHHDLPGVLQMLGHAHQTGALHINAGATDALLFFDAGVISHAECGNLFGDEAVIHIIKSCVQGGAGVYKFVYGTTSVRHTVLRSATDLMLDAMRSYDESLRDQSDETLFASLSGAPGSDFDNDSGGQDSTPPPAASLDATNPDAEIRDAEIHDPEPGNRSSLDSTEPFSDSASLEAGPDTPDTAYHDSKEPSFRPSGLPTHPESLLSPSEVTERILSDLTANSQSPIDVALADLLSNQSAASHEIEGHAEPSAREIHPQDANESDVLDPESADKEHHE